MSTWNNRIYTIPQKISDHFVALSDAGHYEEVAEAIVTRTDVSSVHTDELRTGFNITEDDFKTQCQKACRIINNFYKKYFTK